MPTFTKILAVPLAAASLLMFATASEARPHPRPPHPAPIPRPIPPSCNSACQANKATGGGKLTNGPTTQAPRPVMTGGNGSTGHGSGTNLRAK
jgi:hypothetical protein